MKPTKALIISILIIIGIIGIIDYTMESISLKDYFMFTPVIIMIVGILALMILEKIP